MSKISVVITCYNYANYLDESLSSALAQTLDDLEIIVIDDGSTDHTAQVMERFLSHPGVRYVRQENRGQPKAKNRGISESQGEFIAFLDADDVWSPDKLKRQLPLFSDPAVGVVYSRRVWIDPQGRSIPGNERQLRRGKILDHIFVDNFICFSSSVVRRDLLVDLGGFDETLPMGIDYDLWIRLAARCSFDFVDAPLVKYRTGHGNLSKNTARRYECATNIMNKSLADPFVSQRLSWWVPRLAWADTWSNMGYSSRQVGQFGQALSYYFKALWSLPVLPAPWKGLLCCLLKRS